MARVARYGGEATFQLMSYGTEAVTTRATRGPTSENCVKRKFAANLDQRKLPQGYVVREERLLKALGPSWRPGRVPLEPQGLKPPRLTQVRGS